MEAVICGIDPGLGATGYAVLRSRGERCSVLDAGVCRFDEKLSLDRRLADLDRDITSLLAEHNPDCLAVEELAKVVEGNANQRIKDARKEGGSAASKKETEKILKELEKAFEEAAKKKAKNGQTYGDIIKSGQLPAAEAE